MKTNLKSWNWSERESPRKDFIPSRYSETLKEDAQSQH